MSKVTCITVAYNAEKTLRQTVESVLAQTYKDFLYILVDHGSTDCTRQIIQEYERADTRVHGIYVTQNRGGSGMFALILDRIKRVHSEWLAILDADDWWDPEYIERLLVFAIQNDLDIVCTGSRFHYEASQSEGERKLPKPLILDHTQYHLAYPLYHAFFRTIWGKLIRKDITKECLSLPLDKVSYGPDTILAFQWLRNARRMGVDSSVLHHYRVYNASASYNYNSLRVQSDVYLYNDAIDFLRPYGPVSPQNQIFLYQVYANAVLDTMQVIQKSSLSTKEKLHEYAEIAAHPITQMAYRCPEQTCQRSRECLLNLVCTEGLKLRGKDEDLRRAFQALLPRCGLAVTGKNLPLFLSRELKERFLQDDRDGVVRTLVPLLPRIKNPQQCELGSTVQRLAVEHPLLFQVNDLAFLQTYADLYLLLWDNQNLEALDQMTGLLLEEKVASACETFLTLYINLAALENQVPAFLFGKIRLVQYYLDQGSSSSCRKILQELDEMGVGEQEDVVRLKALLDQ